MITYCQLPDCGRQGIHGSHLCKKHWADCADQLQLRYLRALQAGEDTEPVMLAALAQARLAYRKRLAARLAPHGRRGKPTRERGRRLLQQGCAFCGEGMNKPGPLYECGTLGAERRDAEDKGAPLKRGHKHAAHPGCGERFLPPEPGPSPQAELYLGAVA